MTLEPKAQGPGNDKPELNPSPSMPSFMFLWEKKGPRAGHPLTEGNPTQIPSGKRGGSVNHFCSLWYNLSVTGLAFHHCAGN